MYYQSKNKHAGYSIVEVLVAITVLLVAIVGPLTIAAKGLQTAQLAREQNTAAFLAQEGIEIVMAVRNSRALDFFDGGTTDPWDWVPGSCVSTGDGCSVSFDNSGTTNISACASKEACRLYLGNSGRMWYTTNTADDRTPFVRQVYIDPQGTDQVEVRSVVSWDSTVADSEREVELLTVITNIYQP